MTGPWRRLQGGEEHDEDRLHTVVNIARSRLTSAGRAHESVMADNQGSECILISRTLGSE